MQRQLRDNNDDIKGMIIIIITMHILFTIKIMCSLYFKLQTNKYSQNLFQANVQMFANFTTTAALTSPLWYIIAKS